MMKRSVHNLRTAVSSARRLLTTGLFGTLLLSQSGCIMEKNDGCQYSSNLYIVVDSEDSGYDETLSTVTLYLFGGSRTFIDSLEVTPGTVTGHLPIPISYNPNDIPWTAVWGNLGDSEQVVPPTSGETMEQAFVAMRRRDDGYAAIPDNLYFGARKLVGEPEEEVVIAPKTGRVTITAQGIWQHDASDKFYFTVETPYDRYDFRGNASAGNAVLKLSGTFAADGVFATDRAYPMFHFPTPDPDGKSLRVRFYRQVGGSGELQTLADVQYDDNAMPITILRAKTTNILIVLPDTGKIQASVVVTGWEETYQWDDAW